MILLLFVMLIVSILIWKYSEDTKTNNPKTKITNHYSSDFYGDFNSDRSNIETKLSACNFALAQISRGTSVIKDQFLRKKNEEFNACKLNVGKAMDLYKKTFKEVTGSDLTDDQIRKLKKDNGIDF